MPRVRTHKTRPPKGYDEIEGVLEDFEQKLRDATNESHEGKRKKETVWPIFKIVFERSRYIYDLFYRKKEISRELYDWLLRENYADANLIAKWKKQGYERLCCLRCAQSSNHNFGGACICRVPLSKRQSKAPIECDHCGCKGCASSE